MPRQKLDRPNYRLRLRGKIWVIDYTDQITGHTRRISTGESERRRAETWRDQWIAGREQPAPPSQPRIADVLDGYLASRKPHVASYATLAFSAAAVRRHVGNLEPRMLARRTYVDRRAREGVSDGTIRREVGVVRAALETAARDGWIENPPHVVIPPRPAARGPWLTKDEGDRPIHGAATPPGPL